MPHPKTVDSRAMPADALRAALAGVAALCVAFALLCATANAAPTVVSLQFDDGYDDNVLAAQMLEAHGMRGTFYLNSSFIGNGGHLTWPEVRAIQAAGHDVGGHTMTHENLTKLTEAKARRQICNDRAVLFAHGIASDHFSFPFGARTPREMTYVQECGYLSARQVGGLAADCGGCPYAIGIPPEDRYSMQASELVSGTTLAAAKRYVTGAVEHGGGWVQIYSHHVCDCPEDEYSVAPGLLDQFLGWLAAQPDVEVETVADVLDRGGPSVRVGDLVAKKGVTPISAVTTASARRVRFFVDGKQLGTRTKAPYRWNWKSADAAPGPHEVMVLLEDAAGNSAASKPVTFTVR
jgi:peptidoglycan/xylan/chitin deacetylase (PgdA/CDA1 family)